MSETLTPRENEICILKEGEPCILKEIPYITFLIPIENVHQLKTIIQKLNSLPIMYSPRPELSAIVGNIFTEESYTKLQQEFRNIYYGIGDPGYIIITPPFIDFPSSQIVAVYRAFSHDYPPDAYKLSQEGHKVKNGFIEKTNKSIIQIKQTDTPDVSLNLLNQPNTISPKDIQIYEPTGYAWVSIDYNNSTQVIQQNPEKIEDMIKFLYYLYTNLLQLMQNSQIIPMSLIGDSFSFLIPESNLSDLQKLLNNLVENYQGEIHPFKTVSIPFGERKIWYEPNIRIPVWFEPPLSLEEKDLIKSLEDLHKQRVEEGRWKLYTIATLADLEN